MATTWKFVEYDEDTGEILHAATFEFVNDPPQTWGEFVQEAKKKGKRDVVRLNDADPLPDALQKKIDPATKSIIDRPQPTPPGGPRP